MRTVRINFTAPWKPMRNSCVLGYIGEHNATRLEIVPPADMQTNNDIVSCCVVFETGGLLIHSEKLDFAETMHLMLPIQLTMNKNIKLQLEAYDSDGQIIMKSQTVTGLVFLNSPTGIDTEYDDTLAPAIAGAFKGEEFVEIDEKTGYVTKANIYNFYPENFLEKCNVIRLINVKKLASRAFDSFSQLVTIKGMENVETLPASCFYYCYKLKDITLNPSLTEIPQYCFDGCSSLENLDIPNTVTSIGKYAFYCCSALKNVSLSNVADVGECAFSDCKNLICDIWSSGFTSIGMKAFSNCLKLNFTHLLCTGKIGDSAFYSCIAIENVEIDAQQMGLNVFKECSGLKSVKILNDTVLGNSTFYNCTALETCTFDKPQNIPASCFYGCTSLVMEYIESDNIGYAAFSYCDLKKVLIKAKTIENNAFMNNYNLTNMTLEPGIESVGDYSFYQAAFKYLYTPLSLTNIGISAFWGNAKLEYVNLPGITKGAQTMFGSCTGLKDVVIGSGGNSVQSLDRYTFSNCLQEFRINVYKDDPDTPLAYQPWGAVNATVTYLQS